MGKLRIGVLGAGRGMTMIEQLLGNADAQLTAVCDQYEPVLRNAADCALRHGTPIQTFTSFDEFLNCPLDAVVLANYANAHAPFAIRCLKKGLHVLSEVLPVQTMREAVELIEAVETSGKVYAYAENYCFMPAPREMRRLYRAGRIGAFEYGEGEYMHNCEKIWPSITQGNPDHWRNRMYATFYCTHSIGPLIHITGLRPVSVTAFELPHNERMARMGAKGGHAAVEMITLENGAVIKSLHGVGCSRDSIWYSIYGSDGRLESAREDAGQGDVSRLYANLVNGGKDPLPASYLPQDEMSLFSQHSGHGGSDFYTTHHFIRKLLNDPEAETIDVYEALDMFLPGLMGYRSVLQGGIPVAIPDLRDPAQRERFRNDTACVDPTAAGEQLLPSFSKGDPVIPDAIYQSVREQFLKTDAQPKQLKLILFPKNKLPLGLPEGYAITNYNGSREDAEAWLEICKNGLISDTADWSTFRDFILRDYIHPEKDCFFIEHNGKKVATVTAVDDSGNGMGYIHMVSVLRSERGNGLGNVLNRLAETKLFKAGVRIAYLTTDDFRKPACRSYLSAGFYPVNYDRDMPDRWRNLIREFGIPAVQMLKENGEPDRMLFAEE